MGDMDNIFNAFGVSMAVLVVYTTVIICLAVLKKNNRDMPKIVTRNVMIMYLILLVTITQLPFGSGAKGQNFVPFVSMLLETTSGYLFDVGHFFRYLTLSLLNVAMFLPLGFFTALIVMEQSAARRLIIALVIGLAVSAVLETGQLLFPANRIFDVDDLFFNTLGSLLGAVIFNVVVRNRRIYTIFKDIK